MNHLVMVQFPYFTNIPRDVMVNTFHFNWAGAERPTGAELQLLANGLQTFYQNIFIATLGVQLAPWVDKSKVRIKIYNLEDVEPRVPVLDEVEAWTMNSATTSQTPTEVAICLSLKATPVPGVPRASTRGRVYLGGFGADSFTAGTVNSFPSVSTFLMNRIAGQAALLRTTMAGVGWTWNILSRKIGLAFPVVGGFIDNAADTQRRRQQVASARVVWP